MPVNTFGLMFVLLLVLTSKGNEGYGADQLAIAHAYPYLSSPGRRIDHLQLHS